MMLAYLVFVTFYPSLYSLWLDVTKKKKNNIVTSVNKFFTLTLKQFVCIPKMITFYNQLREILKIPKLLFGSSNLTDKS